MRRSRRIIFNALTVLSLVLFLATVGLWVRSYVVKDMIVWQQPDVGRALLTSPGHVIVEINRSDWSGARAGWHYVKEAPNPDGTLEAKTRGYVLNVGPRDIFVRGERAGFAWWQWRGASGNSIGTWVIPLWGLAAGTGLLPMGWLGLRGWRSYAERRKRASGRCVRCGYDLRATPERCPECGAIPANGEA